MHTPGFSRVMEGGKRNQLEVSLPRKPGYFGASLYVNVRTKKMERLIAP